MSIYFDLRTIDELIGDNYFRAEKEFTIEELSKYDGTKGNPSYVAVEGIVYDVSKSSAWNGGKHFNLTPGKDLTEQFASCHGMVKLLSKLPKVGILKVTAGTTGEPTGGMTMSGSPIGGMTMGSGSMGDMTMGGMTMGGSPMGGMNMSGSPMGGMTMGGSPMGGMNMSGSPMGGMTMSGTPTGGMTMNGTKEDTTNFTPDDWVNYITPLVNRALAEASQGINPRHLYEEFILSGILIGLGKTPQEAIDQIERMGINW